MTDQPGGPVAEYVALLRGFGLDDAEIVSLHGSDPGVDDPDAVGHLRVQFDDTAPGALFDRLPGALGRSSRGLSAPLEYWDSVPPVQLADVLEPYGYDVDVDDGEEGSLSIRIEDLASGQARNREFTYPEGPLGENNYAALVHAVEETLGTDALTFVLLAPTDDRWRFVLVEADDLDSLRAEYGRRVRIFDRALTCECQPPAFADGAPPGVASAFVEGADRTDRDSGAFQEVSPGSDPESEATAGAGSDASAEPDDGPTTPAETDESTEAATTDSGEVTAPDDAPEWVRRAAASEGSIDAVVEALSEGGPRKHVSGRTADDVLDEVPDDRGDDDPETGTGIDEVFEAMEASVDREDGGPSRVVADRGVDDVFEEMDGEGAGTHAEAEVSSVETPEVPSGDEEAADSLVGGGPRKVVVEDDVFAEFEDDSDDLADIDEQSPEELVETDPEVEPGIDEETEAEINDLFGSLDSEMAEFVADPETEELSDSAAGETAEAGRAEDRDVSVDDVVDMAESEAFDSPFATGGSDAADAGAGNGAPADGAEAGAGVDPGAEEAGADVTPDPETGDAGAGIDPGTSGADTETKTEAGDGDAGIPDAGTGDAGVDATSEEADAGIADAGTADADADSPSAEAGTDSLDAGIDVDLGSDADSDAAGTETESGAEAADEAGATDDGIEFDLELADAEGDQFEDLAETGERRPGDVLDDDGDGDQSVADLIDDVTDEADSIAESFGPDEESPVRDAESDPPAGTDADAGASDPVEGEPATGDAGATPDPAESPDESGEDTFSVDLESVEEEAGLGSGPPDERSPVAGADAAADEPADASATPDEPTGSGADSPPEPAGTDAGGSTGTGADRSPRSADAENPTGTERTDPADTATEDAAPGGTETADSDAPEDRGSEETADGDDGTAPSLVDVGADGDAGSGDGSSDSARAGTGGGSSDAAGDDESEDSGPSVDVSESVLESIQEQKQANASAQGRDDREKVTSDDETGAEDEDERDGVFGRIVSLFGRLLP